MVMPLHLQIILAAAAVMVILAEGLHVATMIRRRATEKSRAERDVEALVVRELRVVDQAGRVRIAMGTDPRGPLLAFFRSDGVETTVMAEDAQGMGSLTVNGMTYR